MDLNSGLTQALSDGTNTYIYGLDRIAQTHASTTDYFLTDALGSVRQLTDPTGAITFARTYDPYGVTTQTTGVAQTAYGYTGEFTANNLVYLRARQYAPAIGRFLTRDTWDGDSSNPITQNYWLYAYANPILYIDPSGNTGMTPEQYEIFYGISFTGNWPELAKNAVYAAVESVGKRLLDVPALAGVAREPYYAFRYVFYRGVNLTWDTMCYNCRPNTTKHLCVDNKDFGEHDPNCKPVGGVTLNSHQVVFASLWLSGTQWGPWDNASERARNNVVHELGHVFDNLHGDVPSSTLSATWVRKVGLECFYQEHFPHVNPDVTGNYGFASSSDIRTWQMHPSGESKEEFADMFLGWVFNRWETDIYGLTSDGSARSQWMDKYMNIWLNYQVAMSGG